MGSARNRAILAAGVRDGAGSCGPAGQPHGDGRGGPERRPVLRRRTAPSRSNGRARHPSSRRPLPELLPLTAALLLTVALLVVPATAVAAAGPWSPPPRQAQPRRDCPTAAEPGCPPQPATTRVTTPTRPWLPAGAFSQPAIGPTGIPTWQAVVLMEATPPPAQAGASAASAALTPAAARERTEDASAAAAKASAPTSLSRLEQRLSQWPAWQLPAPLRRPTRQAPRWPAWFVGEWLVHSSQLPEEPNAAAAASPTWRARFLADGRDGAVADRAFNALSVGRSLLGDQLLSVQDDPADSRRQLARLRGDRFLETTLLGQRGESPTPDRFLNDELSLQVLHGPGATAVSRIETLGRWQLHSDGSIWGEQWQASYGSPADGLNSRALASDRFRIRLVPVPPGSDPAS